MIYKFAMVDLGPYIKYEGENYKLPKTDNIELLSEAECVQIIAQEKEKKKGRKEQAEAVLQQPARKLWIKRQQLLRTSEKQRRVRKKA